MSDYASITIDMDGFYSYRQIHDLPFKNESPSKLLKVTIPTILRFLEQLNLNATFFLIGKDITEAQSSISKIVKANHEIANHSWSHSYNLAYKSKEFIKNEIENTHLILSEFGQIPVGFRSPGYHLSPNLLQVLEEQNYTYSSSQMPGIVYPTAKLTVKTIMYLNGKNSQSVMHPIHDIFTPSHPYIPNQTQCHKQGKSKIIEFPISKSRFPFPLPYVGFFIMSFPFNSLMILPKSPLIINLHGIDFLPDEITYVENIRNSEPYLKIPLDLRLKRLANLINYARFKRKTFVPLKNLVKLYKK